MSDFKSITDVIVGASASTMILTAVGFALFLSLLWVLLPILILGRLNKLAALQTETNRLLNFVSDQLSKLHRNDL